MKKKLIASAMAVAAALSTSSVFAAEKIKLEVWTMSMAPKFSHYFTELTTQFNQKNPNLEAIWVDMNWDQIQPKLIAAIAAGNPPALVNFNVPWVHDFARQGNILPLDEYLGADKNLYQANALNDVTYKGKIYAFPWYNSVSVIAYNKELFDKAGIKTAPKSFDELLAQAKTITEKTKIPAFAPKLSAESGGSFINWFYYAGLPVIENGKAVFNSPKHIALLQKFTDLYKVGAMPKDVFKMEFEQEIAAYNTQRIAMMTTAPQALKRTQTDSKAIYAKTDIAAFPIAEGKMAFGGWMMDYVIPKGAKSPSDAAKLGKFMTSDAAQLAFSKETGTTFPSTKLAATDGYFMSGAKSSDPVEKSRAIAALSIGNAKTLTLEPGVLPDEATMQRALQNEIQAAITGRKSAKAALDAAVKNWNARLAK
ncbi:ABC transporter substrate-binding protein [Iodobacter arcticus]|uniref:ABC transporter substrate-binding protein n=1 Tax=Iodobacter arcticus TaxID=590593 RepID=A0ABW2QTH9_9NEIS